jgi:septum formation protein
VSQNRKVILATKSPYLRSIFSYLEIPFRGEESNFDRNTLIPRSDDPIELVLQFSKLKAEAVANARKDGIVIGMHSVGWLEGNIFRKPKSLDEARRRLQALSGKKCKFFTGIYFVDLDFQRIISRCVITKIDIRKLSSDEIVQYVERDPSCIKFTMGFDPLKTRGASFVSEIDGSYNNFIRGVPLEVITEMLKEVGHET